MHLAWSASLLRYQCVRFKLTTDAFDEWMEDLLKAQKEAAAKSSMPPHVDSPDCWCSPKMTYEDPVSGSQVWVHQYPENSN